jgi:hypothetical protein
VAFKILLLAGRPDLGALLECDGGSSGAVHAAAQGLGARGAQTGFLYASGATGPVWSRPGPPATGRLIAGYSLAANGVLSVTVLAVFTAVTVIVMIAVVVPVDAKNFKGGVVAMLLGPEHSPSVLEGPGDLIA